eukprot:TRINITY_DN9943_c0_g1_i6.p1 TRINITY_DN9943_c0_g1~~TRINITY_DN9943_c0_g1_i6.p1  ORF type:complete len:550 (-),score=161.39 TRINITY_DN9943_c0_g1_i6:124-1773(-)
MANTPSSIVCFKNGFSFVTVPVILENSEEENAQIKSCTIGPLPSFAVHGTVGLQANNPESVKIFSLSKAPKDDEKLKLPVGPDFSYHAFLEANLFTTVRIQVNYGNNNMQYYQGRVKWVQTAEHGPKMAILETTENNVKLDKLIDTSKIVHLERTGMEDIENGRSSLLVRYAAADKSDPSCTLSYLTNGLTWAPSYSVLMNTETKTVKLEGKACLLCDLPFLDGGSISEISLVAGEPNMEYQHLSDPLASGASASDFVSQLGGGQRFHERAAPRMMKSQLYGAPMMEGAFGAAPPMEEAEGIKGGESFGDFFHYNLKNVPLKFNHPLSIPFIEECDNIEYEDVYYLDLDKNDQGLVEVKHAISFKNTSGQPLTTAPVSILGKTNDNNSKFMVQGMMKFTNPSKNATIEITRTMDVEGKFVVETKERKTEVINEAGGTGMFGTGKKQYVDFTQKSATVSIKNYKDEEIKCKIEHQLYGHLEESTPVFKDKTERQNNHHGLNPTTKYTWEVTVPAGGKTEISFQFCVKEWNHSLNKKQQEGTGLFGGKVPS